MRSSIREPLVSQQDERTSILIADQEPKKQVAAKRPELYAERLGFEVLDKDILEEKQFTDRALFTDRGPHQEGVHVGERKKGGVKIVEYEREVESKDEAPEHAEEPSIDFKTMYKEYKDRTEFSLPYTMARMQDAMFLDEHRLVTLEHIFYSQDGAYTKLIRNDKDKGTFGKSESGRDSYNKVPYYYEDQQVEYFDEWKARDMPVMEAAQGIKVEAVLTLWSINSKG